MFLTSYALKVKDNCDSLSNDVNTNDSEFDSVPF